MEDLLGALGGGLRVTAEPCALTSQHPRFVQYKCVSSREKSQDLRRSEVLKRQTEKRFDLLNHCRGLATGVFQSDGTRDEPMDDTASESSVKIRRPAR